jgi:hypothetical protein
LVKTIVISNNGNQFITVIKHWNPITKQLYFISAQVEGNCVSVKYLLIDGSLNEFVPREIIISTPDIPFISLPGVVWQLSANVYVYLTDIYIYTQPDMSQITFHT